MFITATNFKKCLLYLALTQSDNYFSNFFPLCLLIQMQNILAKMFLLNFLNLLMDTYCYYSALFKCLCNFFSSCLT